jgi:hypothetical protein
MLFLSWSGRTSKTCSRPASALTCCNRGRYCNETAWTELLAYEDKPRWLRREKFESTNTAREMEWWKMVVTRPHPPAPPRGNRALIGELAIHSVLVQQPPAVFSQLRWWL